ncbi:MAG: response regulator [Proteobacteria bacterium]|nr:response regulator [Pseudomonadota bacterium]
MTHILVVEDHAANRKLVRDLLRLDGYQVLEASSADAGIACARAKRPELIIMDIQLPGMDGLAAIRILRADPATQAIPIIAVTAYAMQGDEQRILAAGCERYIAKPIQYREFQAIVRGVLGGTR